MAIKKVLVVGLGLMGRGILQVCAQNGFETYGYDVSEDAVKKAAGHIEKSLDKRVQKGKMTEADKDKILSNIKPVTDLSEAKDVDLAIEAVFEDIKIKQDVFRKLDEVLQPNAILASNTSALPATPLASVTKRPDKFMIIHFHQPPTVMRLIELVKAIQTSDETAALAVEFCKAINKDPVQINVDCPGFLTNRTMIPLLNEVIYCIYEGVSTKEDIDLAFKSGFNWPMGPVTLCDFIGLDTLLHIMEDLHARRGGDKFIPCPL
ncbi:MAG: 3-hydroxybutyryl-CoA dehydrogenase, partial [Syntrophobacterales bacterium]|nr:3-hydroxybutyryl-CoA dehydrogenase [Syntrophobacterales bacterium]